ncbi:MAG: hypothetical protein DRQ40_05305 [Gammaproteobacteria bacterium]|nr:MAG: hypothetical protein DRQ40_05305 [Gammaproteobacteria bacterium]
MYVTIEGLESHGTGKALTYLTVDGTSYFSTSAVGKATVTGAFAQSANVTMSAFDSMSSDYPYSEVIVGMNGFTTSSGQDLLSHETAIAVASQLGFGSKVTILSGTLSQSSAVMPSFDSLSSDYIYNEVDVDLPPFEIFGGQYLQLDGVAFLSVPSRILEGVGSVSLEANGANLLVPSRSALGFTGAVTVPELTTPALSLEAEGSVANIGRAEIFVPKIILEAFVNPGSAGRGIVIHRGKLTLTGYSGAVVPTSFRVPKRSMLGEATVVNLGVAELLVPRRTIVGYVDVEEVNYGELVVPPVAMLSGIFDNVWGRYSIQAHGYQEFEESLDAFVMNTANNGLTKYERYGFTNIITADNKNYGVTDTGVYLIGGDSDAAGQIAATFTMYPVNYETLSTKNVTWAYIAARSSDQFIVESYADEVKRSGKTTMSHGRTDLYNWRVQFGRGVKACNWGFTISNRKGGDFQIQSFNSEPFEHKRKV